MPYQKLKRATITLRLNRQLIAQTCDISIRTLYRILKKDNINLKNLSLKELIDFINKYSKPKEKIVPLQTNQIGDNHV